MLRDNNQIHMFILLLAAGLCQLGQDIIPHHKTMQEDTSGFKMLHSRALVSDL
jgi:hypothetical protein